LGRSTLSKVEDLLRLLVFAWEHLIEEFPFEVLLESKVDKGLPEDSMVTAATFYIIITNNYMYLCMMLINSPVLYI
jgi:hypothetical protein